MKLKYITSLLILLVIVLLTGCDSINPNKPATAFDNAVLTPTATNYVTEIVTNYVALTNTAVVFQTNTVGVIVLATNYVTALVPQTITNVTEHITYAPNPVATGLITTAGTLLGPIGQPIAAGLVGLIALLAGVKSKQVNTLTAISTNLSQSIEVARSVLYALPDKTLGPAFDNWLKAHQSDADLLNQIGAFVNEHINTSVGKAAGTGAAANIISAAAAT